MDIFKVTARWSGFQGAPGFSNFYFSSGFLDGGLLGDEAQAVAERVQGAFLRINSELPLGVSIAIDTEVPVIDSDTGMVQDFHAVEDIDNVNGAGESTYAGPAGAVVTWRTNDLRNGRRIRGRTFIVPLASDSFQADGTLVGGTISALRNFADDMIGGSLQGDFGVWSRPVNGSGGVFASVTQATVPDMVAVLRSRRD